jgi:hypothetical protein
MGETTLKTDVIVVYLFLQYITLYNFSSFNLNGLCKNNRFHYQTITFTTESRILREMVQQIKRSLAKVNLQLNNQLVSQIVFNFSFLLGMCIRIKSWRNYLL